MIVWHQDEVNQLTIVPRVGCNGFLDDVNQPTNSRKHVIRIPIATKYRLRESKIYAACPFFSEVKYKHFQDPMGLSMPYQKSIVSQYQLKERICNQIKGCQNSHALYSTIESVIDNRKLLRNQCNRQLYLTQQINNQLSSDYERTC